MTFNLGLVIMAGSAIAWANGLNDVSKGIATLPGAAAMGITLYGLGQIFQG